jgi:hypothetical protein
VRNIIFVAVRLTLVYRLYQKRLRLALVHERSQMVRMQ